MLIVSISSYLSEPAPVRTVSPREHCSTSVIFSVQMPGTGVFDGIHLAVGGGPHVTRLLKHDSKITADDGTPGMEYNFFVSTISGTKLSTIYHVPTVKPCKYFSTCPSCFPSLILCAISNLSPAFTSMQSFSKIL